MLDACSSSFDLHREFSDRRTGGQEFGGDNPEKLRKLNEKYYRSYGAVLGRTLQRKKGIPRKSRTTPSNR